MYYVSEKSDDMYAAETYTLWDVADMFMAGYSWASFFGDVSWRTFGWAVLDTAALLPLLPSSAYFRQGGKLVVKADAIINRHAFNATYADTSKFVAAVDIKSLIKSTLTDSSSVSKYVVGDGKYVIQKDFKSTIGTSSSGKKLTKIKVILGSNGNVITAYPIEYFQTKDYF